MEQKEKKSVFKKWWFWVIAVIVILIITGSSSENTKTQSDTSNNSQSEQKVEAIKLTSETLRQAYKANEVNADNLYKGKLVEISGIIDTIGKDISDQAYVTFKTNESISFDKVQCMFRSTEQVVLATLKKDQDIKVEGTVSGVTIGSVIVRNCTVL